MYVLRSVNSFEDNRPVIGDVQPMPTVQPGIAPTVRMFVFMLTGHGEGWPCGVPELAVRSLWKVEVAEIEITGPPTEIERDEVLSAPTSRESQELPLREADIQG